MAGNLIDYRVEKGVAILELNDPPANTYTYEMNKELDTCILNARMDDDVYVIVLRRSEHQDALGGHAAVQVLLLPPCQRDAQPSRADAEAGHRRAERPHRRRRARDRHG